MPWKLDASGKLILNSAGKVSTACATPSACAYCNDPLPTAYDFEFTGVNACSGFDPIPSHTVTLDNLAGSTPSQPCRWEKTVAGTAGNFVYHCILAPAASSPFNPTMALDIVYPGGGFESFIGEENPYGPDCSITVLISNDWVIGDCGTSTAAGYGGSAAGVAVLPP